MFNQQDSSLASLNSGKRYRWYEMYLLKTTDTTVLVFYSEQFLNQFFTVIYIPV